jgi:hypothetical protein
MLRQLQRGRGVEAGGVAKRQGCACARQVPKRLGF